MLLFMIIPIIYMLMLIVAPEFMMRQKIKVTWIMHIEIILLIIMLILGAVYTCQHPEIPLLV